MFAITPPVSVGGGRKKMRVPPAVSLPRFVDPTTARGLFVAIAARLVNGTVLFPDPPSTTFRAALFGLVADPPVADSAPNVNVLPTALAVSVTTGAAPAVAPLLSVRLVARPVRLARFVPELSTLNAPP